MNDTEESVARKYALGQIGDGPSDPKHDEESIKLAVSYFVSFFLFLTLVFLSGAALQSTSRNLEFNSVLLSNPKINENKSSE